MLDAVGQLVMYAGLEPGKRGAVCVSLRWTHRLQSSCVWQQYGVGSARRGSMEA